MKQIGRVLFNCWAAQGAKVSKALRTVSGIFADSIALNYTIVSDYLVLLSYGLVIYLTKSFNKIKLNNLVIQQHLISGLSAAWATGLKSLEDCQLSVHNCYQLPSGLRGQHPQKLLHVQMDSGITFWPGHSGELVCSVYEKKGAWTRNVQAGFLVYADYESLS
jgi:hypothetical protein